MTPPKLVVTVRNLIRAVVFRLGWLPPLLVRIMLGVVFIQSGWGHLHNIADMTENFVGWHIPFPHFNAVLSGATELIGGCFILAGLLTRMMSVPLIITMAVAIAAAKWSHIEDWTDFFGFDELAYALLFLWLAVAGAGKASLDYLIGKKLDLLV